MKDITTYYVLKPLLIGIYLIYLSWSTKFRAFLGFGIVFILWAVFYFIFPSSYGIRIAILAIPFLTVFIYGFKEILEWDKKGMKPQIDVRDVLIGFLFIMAYVLIKELL